MTIEDLDVRARFADGSLSEPFRYTTARRERFDAVVVVPHFRGADGRTMIVLRSALRPPPTLRPAEAEAADGRVSTGEFWEVPAGLVGLDERSPEGLRQAARRELLEETGFDVALEDLRPLGPAMFPVPAVIAERHFYFHVEVDPTKRGEPTLDGSVLERNARLETVSLDDAILACQAGEIEDEKTELALRRLREL